MDYINDLHELCETISKEIGEANDKIRNAGGKLSAGDVDYIDKLTHTLKSIKAVIAMMEDEDGYSGNYPMYMRNRPYAPRRDSMGRYSTGRMYSRTDGIEELVDNVREMMQDLPPDVQQDAQKFVRKLEQEMA